MIRLMYGEEFREIDFSELNFKKRYAISNKGRLISFTEAPLQDGILINGSKSDGYKLFKYKRTINGKIQNFGIFFYKLVAEHFLPPPDPKQEHLIHLDHSRDNDVAENLKWVTSEEFRQHYDKSPSVIRYKNTPKPNRLGITGKLTETQVIRIKKSLKNPKGIVRISRLAKQFGVSEMQIRRIKSGENWSHVKV